MVIDVVDDCLAETSAVGGELSCLFGGGGAVALGEEEPQELFFLFATCFQQQVHVVPAGWYFVAGVVAVEGVDDCAGFVAFEGVAGIVDVAVEDFGSLLGVAVDHVVVGVTSADEYFHVKWY